MKIKIKNIFPEYRMDSIKHFEGLKIMEKTDIETLETSIYQYTIDFATKYNIKAGTPEFVKIYKNKFVHIMLNLDLSDYVKNEYIHTKVKNKEIELAKLPSMLPRDMCPDKWKFYEKIEATQVNAISVGNLMLNRTSLFSCSRCKNNDTEYIESQTRSADEPTTFYITCRVCGKKWVQ
jgi:DNA-directed RNA polymerase subunit M/transcription elongation factor TFIIS